MEGVEKECSGWKKIEQVVSGCGIGEGGASIKHSREGTKLRLKMTLLNFWIKLSQNGISKLKKWKLPSNSTNSN